MIRQQGFHFILLFILGSLSLPAASAARSIHAYPIPDVALIDMDGAKRPLASILETDKPLMLSFVFTTCPSVCSVLTAVFSQFQQKLGPQQNKVAMVSISIDPEHDSPEKLAEYARKFKAGPQWKFFTGSFADITKIQKSFDAYRGDKTNHRPLIFLRASRGAPWVRLEGLVSSGVLLQEYTKLTTQ
jgi:protein SCO1/2